MLRARGLHWAALSLATLVSIAGCDRDDDGATASDDAGDESADLDPTDASEGDPAPLTCAELRCPGDEVCVEPRPYCDHSGDEPELRRDPAYCRPMDATPPGAGAVDEAQGLAGVEMGLCGDLQPTIVEGPLGQRMVLCPEIELPC